MKALRVPPMYKCIGLVDADLLDNGTRHPNLALLKIAGFLYDNHIPFELILDSNIDLERYDHIYLSRVFTFTKLPKFYTESIGTINENKFHIGGRGFYATIESITLDMQMTNPYGRKQRGTQEPPDKSERGEWKSWLKTQHSEN